MNKLQKKIDLFCYNHPHFGIRGLMLYIVAANVLIWMFMMFGAIGGSDRAIQISRVLQMLTFQPSMILRGQVWRLVTFMLLPNSSGILALFFFYFYYLIGTSLESHWGTPKFNIYFFFGVILTILYGFIYYIATVNDISITASYVYLSMFFSFAAVFPETEVLLFFIIPIKIKWLAYFDGAFFIYSVLTTSFPLNMLPVVAVLNFLIFCWPYLFRKGRPTPKQRAKTINYKREARRVNEQQRKAPYTRKCEVCGRTDADYPDLEFRYCSKCVGYHCYCIDHINNHIHITQ